MSTELAPSEHSLLLNPLDQSDAVRLTSNPLPDVLTSDHALSSADVQTALPTSQVEKRRLDAEAVHQPQVEAGAPDGTRHALNRHT